MILQRLAEHYDRMKASGTKLAQPGFSRRKISFCIVLNADGTLNSVDDMRRRDGKSLQPRSMIVPGQSKPTGSGLNPCFLWDNAEYLLGWTDDPTRSERAAKAFEASRTMHLAQEDAIGLPSYTAVCNFFRGWTPKLGADLAERLTEVTTHFGVFRIAGQRQYVQELVKAPVEAAVAPHEGAGAAAMCLVSGVVGPSARLHEPKIKGVANAQSSGALLVSFNAGAFESYGKEQSHNAPVSAASVFKYAYALNHLLAQRDRRVGLGDATVVFWANHPEPVLDDAFAALFGESANPTSDAATDDDTADENTAAESSLYGDLPAPEEDITRVDEARHLLTQLSDGTRLSKRRPDDEPTKFYILGLSPNASRLSVRLWIEAKAPELERLLGRHLRDLELKSNFDERPLSIRALANATGRYQVKGKSRFDTKGVSPQLVGELARSVLTGAAYPQSFLATLIRRIRSDSYVGYERVSAIKACLVRNARLRGTNQEVPVELDVNVTDVAYRCGRIFALLEKAQVAALGKDLNSTIKDRFFSAASATPALVFPRLFRVNTHHLAKLSQGSRTFYANQFGALMTEPFTFPRQLSLEQQGRFFIGYFQERQYRPVNEVETQEETAEHDE